MSKISWQYPAVELITGLLFLGVMDKIFPFITTMTPVQIIGTLLVLISLSLLMIITVYDLRHKIIPDLFAYLFAASSFSVLVLSIGVSDIFQQGNLLNLLAGPILAAPLAILWAVSRGKWMGLGDAKLMLGIGWFLGLYQGLSALVLSFWIGAIAGLLLIAIKGRKYTIKSEIPFAPFLILGMLLVFFFGIDIFEFIWVI